MIPYNFPGIPDGYGQLEGGYLHAIILEKMALEFGWKDSHYCNIKVVEEIYERSAAFALKKGSPWNGAISSLIRKYRDDGLMDEMKRKYMASKCTTTRKSHLKQFGILYLSGACIFVVLGVALSSVFFVMEHVIDSFVKRCRKNKGSFRNSVYELETRNIDISEV